MFTHFFLIEKDLPLVTLDSPQFQFSVSCYFEILDLYILADFGFGQHLCHWLMLAWEPAFLY